MYLSRTIETAIKRLDASFPVVLITGPRQVGKTTVLQNMQPQRRYVSLDIMAHRRLANEDPALFLQRFPPPVVIDEIQYAPGLFSEIKALVDAQKKPGMFWLTGSQKFQLMKNVRESLAGRVGILDLDGLSLPEIAQTPAIEPFLPTSAWIEQRSLQAKEWTEPEIFNMIWRGSYPALYGDHSRDWEDYYSAYLKSYVDRDLRDLHHSGDELPFEKLLTLLAARSGQLINYSDLARGIERSVPTVQRWISILRTTGLIYLLPPFSRNPNNRMIRLPKIYFMDTGLICYLCRWNSAEALMRGNQYGSIFETFIIAEIIKTYTHNGRTPAISFYRDKEKREIDLILEADGKVYPLEIKTTANPPPAMIKNFAVLEKRKLIVDTGAVICLAPTYLPLTEKVNIIPASYV